MNGSHTFCRDCLKLFEDLNGHSLCDSCLCEYVNGAGELELDDLPMIMEIEAQFQTLVELFECSITAASPDAQARYGRYYDERLKHPRDPQFVAWETKALERNDETSQLIRGKLDLEDRARAVEYFRKRHQRTKSHASIY